MNYHEEAAALDRTILSCIERYAVPDFNALALEIFAHQLRHNEPYARYCAAYGAGPNAMPADWEGIPPVPSSAFKEAAVCTFDPASAQLVFETSGTTRGASGRHYMENAALYDAALLAGFRRGVLNGAREPVRFVNIVPDPRERPQSSLGYMMLRCSQTLGDGRDAWLLHGDTLDVDGFAKALAAATADGVTLCIAGTAFAFVQLLDMLGERGITSLTVPADTRLMETGGFKGRTRVVERAELYRELSNVLGIAQERIIAEYGMTELTSQYYDDPQSARSSARVKVAPPWLRARVTGADGRTLPHGTVGTLVHVDLANRSSCVAVHTEDLGVQTADGLVLIGREHGAQLRGCSLDAEQLRALAHA